MSMFGEAVKLLGQKWKPILKTPPEQRNTIAKALFDIVKEHGPITVGNTWERVKETGLKDLASKSHMKVVLRWMREKKKLRLVCNHVGAHKQFLYTIPTTSATIPSKQKPSCKL